MRFRGEQYGFSLRNAEFQMSLRDSSRNIDQKIGYVGISVQAKKNLRLKVENSGLIIGLADRVERPWNSHISLIQYLLYSFSMYRLPLALIAGRIFFLHLNWKSVFMLPPVSNSEYGFQRNTILVLLNLFYILIFIMRKISEWGVLQYLIIINERKFLLSSKNSFRVLEVLKYKWNIIHI